MKNYNLYENRFKDLNKRNQTIKIINRHFFQKFIKPSDNVLDYGSGYCEFINNINCSKKFALDIDPKFKKYVNKDVKFVLSNGIKINIPEISIDKVFVSNVFEHIEREKIPVIVQEFYRILKKNGEVLVLQPNIRFLTKDFWRFFDHITPIDDRALDEIFILNKFTLVKKILKFLPYTTKDSYPQSSFFIKTYLIFPFFWKIFGRQSFLVFRK